MSSSSSLHRNSPRIAAVLFLIAMDEQTGSLILPYQRANWLPQIALISASPQSASGQWFCTYLEREASPPQGWRCVFGGEEQSMDSGTLG